MKTLLFTITLIILSWITVILTGCRIDNHDTLQIEETSKTCYLYGKEYRCKVYTKVLGRRE